MRNETYLFEEQQVLMHTPLPPILQMAPTWPSMQGQLYGGGGDGRDWDGGWYDGGSTNRMQGTGGYAPEFFMQNDGEGEKNGLFGLGVISEEGIQYGHMSL